MPPEAPRHLESGGKVGVNDRWNEEALNNSLSKSQGKMGSLDSPGQYAEGAGDEQLRGGAEKGKVDAMQLCSHVLQSSGFGSTRRS